MLQLFLSTGIQAPELEEYCRDREGVLAEVVNELKVTRAVAKDCILTICHIGNYTQHTAGAKTNFLDSFKTNYVTAVNLLLTRQRFADIWARVQRGEERKNPLGTFVSWTCQMHEATAIAALAAFLTARGGVVRTNSFDGLMAEGFAHLDQDNFNALLTAVTVHHGEESRL